MSMNEQDQERKDHFEKCTILDRKIGAVLDGCEIGVSLAVLSRIAALLISQGKCKKLKPNFLISLDGYLKEYTKDE